MRRTILFVALASMVPLGAMGAEAQNKFHKLTGAEIRARVVGNSITDEAHWSDYYKADGSIATISMGRKSTGKWRINKDELCLWTRAIEGACYQVWVSGREIQLRLAGEDSPFTAYLKKGE